MILPQKELNLIKWRELTFNHLRPSFLKDKFLEGSSSRAVGDDIDWIGVLSYRDNAFCIS